MHIISFLGVSESSFIVLKTVANSFCSLLIDSPHSFLILLSTKAGLNFGVLFLVFLRLSFKALTLIQWESKKSCKDNTEVSPTITFFLAMLHGFQYLQPGIKPGTMVVKAQNPNHETSRELPITGFKFNISSTINT